MTVSPARTLPEALLAGPRERPFLTIWRSDDDIEVVTFGEFIRRVEVQAADFLAQGLQPGHAVILVLPQGADLMVCFAAAMLVRAVPSIMAYPNFKVEPAKYRHGLAGVTRTLKAEFIVLDEDFPSELMSHLACERGTRIVRTGGTPNSSSPPPLPDTPADTNSIAFIQHSAGSTGLQKGVALRHAAVLRQLDHLVTKLQISDQDRIYSWLPLYHDMGLIACFMLPLAYHVPVVMQSPTDWVMQPASMLSLISSHRCTISWVPNFALQFLARRVPRDQRAAFDLSTVRALINCSEPVRGQSVNEFYEAYAPCGLRREALQSSYAMAENVFAVTQSLGSPSSVWVDSKQLTDRHIAVAAPERAQGAVCLISSGPCLPGNRVKIISAEGNDLPDGHVGEVVIQSDSLFDGYYNRPDLTAKVLKNGWYWSGDLGFCLDGELYVIGRKTDLIIVAGKNLYPQDIEEIACSHPRIHDGRAVAFGLFNPNLGTEEVVVVAEVEEESDIHATGSIEQAVRSAIVAELGVAVRRVFLRPPKWIVKSTAGKPARSTTREKLLAEQPELREA